MTSSAEKFNEATNVSRETMGRLATYESLLLKWNPKINLVSKATLEGLWDRHFLDSAQISAHIPEKTTRLTDLGSGGGFPGIVLAIICAESIPTLEVTLIESDQRKAAFMRTVLRETGVRAHVVAERIESADPAQADILTARALAPLDKLLGFTDRHLHPAGTAIFLKGVSFKEEIDVAKAKWSFAVEVIQSKTSQDSVLLKIGDIARA